MSDLICGKTMMRCQTPGMCAPHGGCTPQPVTESVFRADYDTLRTANQRLEGEVKRLREALIAASNADSKAELGLIVDAALADDGGDV